MSILELAQAQVSRVASLTKEYKQLQKRLGEIEAALGSIQASVAGEKSGEKVNKSEAIRNYVAIHKTAKPKEIIQALAEKGIQVGPTAIWGATNYTPTGKKRGRPAKKIVKTGGRGRRVAGKTLADTVLKILSRNKNGLTLTEITQRVKESGYATSAKDSSISPAVQQCLTKLREKEVVSKDGETRRYRFLQVA